MGDRGHIGPQAVGGAAVASGRMFEVEMELQFLSEDSLPWPRRPTRGKVSRETRAKACLGTEIRRMGAERALGLEPEGLGSNPAWFPR